MSAVVLSTTDRKRLPAAIPVVITLGWLLTIAAQATGGAEWVHHDNLGEGGLPIGAALALFLVSWQVMIAAMMLPTTLPLLKLFTATTAGHAGRGRLLGVFLGSYALLWSAFGLAAFGGDLGLHRAVDAWPLLESNEWIIAAGTLGLAGAFQFSSLKDRCLRECRHPAAFLLQHYRRGTASAFQLGIRHGLFCLGCCWALMLLMFAVGVTNLWWMGALTALMVYEKTGRHGQLVAKIAGVDLLLLAALTVILAV